MEKIRDDLWQVTLEDEGGVNSCGFLLLRPEGNVLFYHAPDQDDFQRISELGGIKFHVLSHRHEADPSPEMVKRAFDSKLCGDASESAAISLHSEVDITFDRAGVALGNLEVMLTPGHTEGGVSCAYRSPHGETYLFSGDTMIPVKDNWIAQIVPEHGGDAVAMKRSLLMLGDLDPDLVVSSASVGERTVIEVDHEEWKRAVRETAGRPPIEAT